MALDMYLYKIKRSQKQVDLEEVLKINHYLSWLDRGKEKGYSLEDWYGLSEDEIDLDLVKEYESEFITRYYSWDTEKNYPHKCTNTMVCDWRKANQIHNWFVGNVQNGVDDCDAHEVSKEQLEDLLEICTNVLAHLKMGKKCQSTRRVKRLVIHHTQQNIYQVHLASSLVVQITTSGIMKM